MLSLLSGGRCFPSGSKGAVVPHTPHPTSCPAPENHKPVPFPSGFLFWTCYMSRSRVMSHFLISYLVYCFCDLSTLKLWNKMHIKFLVSFYEDIVLGSIHRLILLIHSQLQEFTWFPPSFFFLLWVITLCISMTKLCEYMFSLRLYLGVEFLCCMMILFKFLSNDWFVCRVGMLFSFFVHISLYMCCVYLFFLLHPSRWD